MERLSQQNVQRNILPGLKGAFGGMGGFGSRRMFDVTGQTLADIQAGLTGQQHKALETGYTQALNTALDEAKLLNTVAGTQGTLASKEQELGLTGAKGLLDAGAIQQEREQAVIESPLKVASNAAALMRGFTIPTGTTQTYKGPMPGAYASSPLQTLIGVASLFGTGTGGGTSPASGTIDFLKDIYGGLKDVFGGSSGGGTADDWANWFNSQFGGTGGGGTTNNNSSSYWGS
jgi:hypothetical protein